MLDLRTLVLPVLALGMTAPPTMAQRQTDFVVDVGLGIGAATQGLGALFHIGVGTPIGDVVLRGAGTSDLAIFVFQAPESSGDLAILYGRSAGGRHGWVRGAVGIGVADSVRRGMVVDCALLFCKYDMIEDRSVGLAFQLDGVWAFSSPFGIGIGAFANINSARSFGGGVVSLHFGRLR